MTGKAPPKNGYAVSTRGRNKFHAVKAPCGLGGKPHVHDSKKERERHKTLLIKEAIGEIDDLRYHVKWPLYGHDTRTGEPIDIGYYESDYEYLDGDNLIVEDTKSPPTREDPYYRLKKRLMKACYGIEIREI